MSTPTLLAMALVVVCSALVFLVYILACLFNRIVDLEEEALYARDTEHAKCLGATMKFVGDEFAAQVLEVAASDYDSVDSMTDLQRIGNLVWKQGGDSVPSLWLQERAEKLRIGIEDSRRAVENQIREDEEIA